MRTPSGSVLAAIFVRQAVRNAESGRENEQVGDLAVAEVYENIVQLGVAERARKPCLGKQGPRSSLCPPEPR